MKIVFFTSLGVLALIYVGYAVAIYVLNKFKKSNSIQFDLNEEALPSLAIVIAAYNEEDIIEAKIKNTVSLNYPANKVKIYIVTDGSTDNTVALVAKYETIKLLHIPERNGKIAAINRAMLEVKEPIVVFSDANAMLNNKALIEMVKHYQNPVVGGVSGEKRVQAANNQNLASTENAYWKYESFIKNQESQFNTLIGAAGELFSLRASLYTHLPADTILDDFMLSLYIVQRGYKLQYEPKAYALEGPSLNLYEEYKRKVRISAGGIQSIFRLGGLSNFKLNRIAYFQYIIHRLLRWAVSPWCLIIALLSNLFLLHEGMFFQVVLGLQLLFHSLALIGWFKQKKHNLVSVIKIPFYFNFMHLCVALGWFRYLSSNQNAAWQKSKRANV
jgi:poly-beta-1,6-N-acetyl-D-glucosamine synthase